MDLRFFSCLFLTWLVVVIINGMIRHSFYRIDLLTKEYVKEHPITLLPENAPFEVAKGIKAIEALVCVFAVYASVHTIWSMVFPPN